MITRKESDLASTIDVNAQGNMKHSKFLFFAFLEKLMKMRNCIVL